MITLMKKKTNEFFNPNIHPFYTCQTNSTLLLDLYSLLSFLNNSSDNVKTLKTQFSTFPSSSSMPVYIGILNYHTNYT